MESLSDDQHRSPQKVAHPDVNSSSFSSPTMSNHAPHTSASRRSIVPIDEDTQFYPDASAITTSPLHLLRDMNLDSPSHQGLSLSQQGLNVSVFSSTDAVNTCRPDIKLTKSSLEDPYLDDNVDGTLSQQSSSEYLPFSDEDRRKKRTPIGVKNRTKSIMQRFGWLGEQDLQKMDSQWLLRRHDTIFDYEYKYRTDACPYPSVKPNFVNVCHMILLVGLPARGKTYISRKLCRYLNWCSIPSKVINLGDYRRRMAGTDRMHDFFRVDNQSAQKIRHTCLMDALDDAMKWFGEETDNKVVILDATNTTVKRRKFCFDYCAERGVKPFFIESICDEDDVIEANIKEVKIYSPDYVSVDKEIAIDDFKKRIIQYENVYDPLAEKCEAESGYSYIKIINAGRQFLVNRVEGYLQSQVVYYLMNIHITQRSLYFTAHGECDHNLNLEIGGQTGLSENGKIFSEALNVYMQKQNIPDLKVWHSSLSGAVETAGYITAPQNESGEGNIHEMWRPLDYLDCGECHGMKFRDLAIKFPAIFDNSKGPLDFTWRYPGGESYKDMLSRLEPVIMELERQHDILVISHRTTMRCLMAYFLDHNPDEVSHMRVPLHTVFKLTPVAYGCRVEKVTLLPNGSLA